MSLSLRSGIRLRSTECTRPDEFEPARPRPRPPLSVLVVVVVLVVVFVGVLVCVLVPPLPPMLVGVLVGMLVGVLVRVGSRPGLGQGLAPRDKSQPVLRPACQAVDHPDAEAPAAHFNQHGVCCLAVARLP